MLSYLKDQSILLSCIIREAQTDDDIIAEYLFNFDTIISSLGYEFFIEDLLLFYDHVEEIQFVFQIDLTLLYKQKLANAKAIQLNSRANILDIA